MSSFAPPQRPVSEIISILSTTGIADLKLDDIAKPSADVIFNVYQNFLDLVDPLNDDTDGQCSFAALEVLDNPDHHVKSIQIFDLYRRVKDMLTSIHITDFTLRDLIAPDAKRTHHILSNIVNFIYYRDTKMNSLQEIVDELQGYQQTKMELEARVAELEQQIANHNAASQMEEPMVQELDTEVKELRQKIQSYNKHQASLKTTYTGLKEKMDVIDDKISKVDFEIVQSGQENVELQANIVQSPEKLRKSLEAKKLHRDEVQQSLRSAEQRVHEMDATLEVNSKACQKMSKLSSKMQDLQDKMKSAKDVDKATKALKATLAEHDVSNMKLDAKIGESRTKVMQYEELIKAAEKEKDLRHAEDNQRLGSVKAETEQKLSSLRAREQKIEATLTEAKSLSSEAELVEEEGKVQRQKMMAKFEEIDAAFRSYGNRVAPHLQMEEVENTA